jgi:probable HAF family extracellular repeat protein
MKPRLLRTSLGLLVVLASPAGLAAQSQGPKPARYTVTDLGTLGGPYSFSYNLNNAGVVSGGSATATQNGDPSQAVVNAPQTAFLWDYGQLRNLGTLGGPDSVGAAANLSNLAVVDSETASLSRQGEDVCGFGTNLQCLAAIWKHGQLSALPLLPGGNNSYALDMNNRGQVVGFSDTDVYDPDCAAAITGTPFRSTAGFRFQAVIWERNDSVRQLAPLDGDSVAWAFGINNRGQVVGASGVCANTSPPPYVSSPHAVLWERDGTPIDLGSLGGSSSGASAINNRGDVSGTSATAEGLVRPFLWTPESRTLVQLDPPSGAFPVVVNTCCKTINDRREIVGFMLDADFNSHAFLWKDGVMVDLNDLIPKDSPWMLQSAAGINDSGQIAGQGLINSEVHAFLATPCHRHEGRGECCENDNY